MNTKSSGTVANENGLTLEDFIENSLVRKGYAVRELQPDGGTNFIRLTNEGINVDPEITVTYTK